MSAPPATETSPQHRAARLLTDLGAPWVLVIIVLLAVGAQATDDPLRGIAWGGLAAVFASVAPILVILARVRTGAATDIHLRQRDQRWIPVAACLTSVFAGMALLYALGAPSDIQALLAAMGASLVAVAVITIRTKISVHALVGIGDVLILTAVYGPWLLLLTPLALAVCWSRIHLRDHTTTQVVLGALVGAAAGALFTATH